MVDRIFRMPLAQAAALLTVVSASAVTLDVPRLPSPVFADREVSGDAAIPAGARDNLRRFRLEISFEASASNNVQIAIGRDAEPLDGALALYRVEVVPLGLIPDEAIHWTRSNDNVAFYSGQDTGREAIIRCVTPGDFTLEVAIDDLPATYRPYIHGRVLDPTVTPIHVYIVCSNGVPAISTNTVHAWVAEANRIYSQAAMSFCVAGMEYVTSNNWFVIGNETEFYQMTSYANVAEGLELYCVNRMSSVGAHSGMQFIPADARCGLAVRADAITSALAHEIGHACYLQDLKYALNDLVGEGLVGAQNWSGGTATGYHSPDMKHRDLVKCILMYYQAEPTITDIPLGSVVGAYAVWGGPETNTAPVTCGLDYMDSMGRTPCH